MMDVASSVARLLSNDWWCLVGNFWNGLLCDYVWTLRLSDCHHTQEQNIVTRCVQTLNEKMSPGTILSFYNRVLSNNYVVSKSPQRSSWATQARCVEVLQCSMAVRSFTYSRSSSSSTILPPYTVWYRSNIISWYQIKHFYMISGQRFLDGIRSNILTCIRSKRSSVNKQG